MMSVSCLMIGLSAAAGCWWGREVYARFLNLVEHDLADRLRSLRIEAPRLRRGINAWLAVVAVVFLVTWLGFSAFAPALFLTTFLSAGPWYLVRRMAQRRRQKLEDQLADAMVMFSSAIRAGLSIPQSLEILAVECPRPIREEFAQLQSEYRLGKPLERTLEEAKTRLRSENFALFAASLLASRESGGRLNATVERMSKSILEIQRLERKVDAETAQARKSAIYMAVAPLLILLLYVYIDPLNTQLLFRTIIGQGILTAAAILNLIAYVWSCSIMNVDI